MGNVKLIRQGGVVRGERFWQGTQRVGLLMSGEDGGCAGAAGRLGSGRDVESDGEREREKYVVVMRNEGMPVSMAVTAARGLLRSPPEKKNRAGREGSTIGGRN